MHTLACLYAHSGKAAQARELLLKAMDGKLEEPDSSVWVAYGQIAEAYGEPEAAQAMYARVDKAQSEVPTSNFALAQQRLLALKIRRLRQRKTVASQAAVLRCAWLTRCELMGFYFSSPSTAA